MPLSIHTISWNSLWFSDTIGCQQSSALLVRWPYPVQTRSSQNWSKITTYEHVHQIFITSCRWFRREVLCDRGFSSDNGLSPIPTAPSQLSVNCTHRNTYFDGILFGNADIFIQEKALEIVVCKMAAISFGSQRVKRLENCSLLPLFQHMITCMGILWFFYGKDI